MLTTGETEITTPAAGPDAKVVTVERRPDAVMVRLIDANASPDQIESDLRTQGINAEVDLDR
jgi:hypothetical protein